MDEEKVKKEIKKKGEEEAADTEDAGDKSESASILKRVVKENERMEANIKRQEEIIARQEEIAAKEILGGRAEAGLKEPEKPKETDEEYAEKVQRGEANPLKDDGFVS